VNQAGEAIHRLEEEAVFTSGDGWGFDNFIGLERLSDPSRGFADDVVIFEASVTVLGQEMMSHSLLETRASLPYVAEDLVSDLRTLWSSSQRSDVILRAEGIELRAHGLILAARSPVFERCLP